MGEAVGLGRSHFLLWLWNHCRILYTQVSGHLGVENAKAVLTLCKFERSASGMENARRNSIVVFCTNFLSRPLFH